MKDFQGKTAFITGGASGIGFGMARAFGRAGMNIVIADIEEVAGKRAVEQLASEQVKARHVHCDVADRASMREAALEAIAGFGKIHVVCNNAGVGGPPGQIGLAKPGEWDWVIDVNLKGVVFGMETFVPLIRSHGEGGRHVNTASLAGLISSGAAAGALQRDQARGRVDERGCARSAEAREHRRVGAVSGRHPHQHHDERTQSPALATAKGARRVTRLSA